MDYVKIHPDILMAIREYADQRREPGDFLRAVLSNDLTTAVRRADADNIKVLPEIVGYCYWEIPGACWGSPEKVEDWLNAGRTIKS